jgi:hypothetical protein
MTRGNVLFPTLERDDFSTAAVAAHGAARADRDHRANVALAALAVHDGIRH